MKRFDYIVPKNLDAALKAQAREPAVLKAAGIDLLDRLKEGLEQPDKILTIGSLEELKAIKEEGESLRIGALVTLADLGRSVVVKTMAPSLHEAASMAASPQIREQATLGGNLCQRPRCWYFRNKNYPCWKKGGDVCFAVNGNNAYHAIMGGGPCYIVHPSNCAIPLVALQAQVVVKREGEERVIPIEEFFVPPLKGRDKETVLEPDEVVTEIVIPKAARASATIELREKQSFDWPVAMASVARLEKGWRVCIGAVAPVPWLSKEAATILGQAATVDEHLAEEAASAALSGAMPLAENAYKVKLARVAIKRALLKASG